MHTDVYIQMFGKSDFLIRIFSLDTVSKSDFDGSALGDVGIRFLRGKPNFDFFDGSALEELVFS